MELLDSAAAATQERDGSSVCYDEQLVEYR